MTISHTQMVAQLVKPGKDIIDGLTSESAHILHMAVGVSGEVGELIENHLGGGSHANRVEELGDIEFYFTAIATELTIDPLHCPDRGINSVNVMMLRLAAHSSALLDAAKKMAVYVRPLDEVEAITQLAEIRALLGWLYLTYAITREEAMAANVHKLYTSKQARYAEGSYSDKQAQARADKQG